MAAGSRPPRTRSARLTLVSLLLIPLLSLAALWGLTASITLGNAIRYQHYNAITTTIGPSVTALQETLPVESALTLVWVANKRQPGIFQAELAKARRGTDRYVPEVRSAVLKVRGLITPKAVSLMNTFLAELAGLSRVRAAVDSGAYDTETAFNAYNAINTAEIRYFQNASATSDPLLGVMTQSAIAEARAQDAMGGAVALIEGAITSGGRADAVRAGSGAAEHVDRRHVLAGRPEPDGRVQAGLQHAHLPQAPGHRDPDPGQPA